MLAEWINKHEYMQSMAGNSNSSEGKPKGKTWIYATK